MTNIIYEAIRRLAPAIDDALALAAAETYLRHASQPGPVVVIVGQAGRGKSALLSALAGCRAPESGVASAAAGAAWSGMAHDLMPPGALMQSPGESAEADLLLVEAPAIDGPGADEALRLARAGDLVIVALHAHQVATASIQAFASRALGETTVVAVVTMADQVDEDDIADVLTAVSEDLTELKALQVLTSGLADPNDPESSVDVCESFERWWHTEGVAIAHRARTARQDQLRRAWLRLGDAALVRMSEEMQAQLDASVALLAAGSSAQQALTIGSVAAKEIGQLPDVASQQLARHLARTSDALRDAVCAELEGQADASVAAMQAGANRAIASWLADAQSEVQSGMDSVVLELTGTLKRMDEAVARLQGAGSTTGGALQVYHGGGDQTEMAPVEGRQDVYPVVLDVPDADLSGAALTQSEQLAPLLGKGVGVIGALAAGGAILAGGPLLPLLAAMGLAAVRFMQGEQSVEGNRRLRSHRLRNTVSEAIARAERAAVDDYRYRWLEFCVPVNHELDRQTRMIRMWAGDNQPALSGEARQGNDVLVRRHTDISDLLSELRRIDGLSRQETSGAGV
jgi:hypothetical protein